MIPAGFNFKKEPQQHIQGKPLFIPQGEYAAIGKDLGSGLINRLKTSLKKIPWLYSFIFYFVAPALFVGRPPKSIYQYVPKGGLVIEIGSGNRRIHPDILNVDIYPWEMVDVLADAHDLPFKDASVDGIVFAWVLEHMKDPVKVAAEFKRILKPGGFLYLSTNFLLPYHPSPKDYYRWTPDGLRELFSDLEILEVKPDVGPTCAFLSVLQDWVAVALSFGIKPLKDILWILMVIITSPFKVLDYIFARYATASDLSAGIYLIAKKR